MARLSRADRRIVQIFLYDSRGVRHMLVRRNNEPSVTRPRRSPFHPFYIPGEARILHSCSCAQIRNTSVYARRGGSHE